jgi:hypothetical protein
VGTDPDAPWVLSTAPRHAHLSGFDLHANVDAPAADRARLEQLCRYLLRPVELLEKLAALIPRPRINLLLYHGLLAPHCRWRAQVVAYRSAAAPETPVGASPTPAANDESPTAPVARNWAWADLMRRAVDVDVLACPRCGGRLRLIATVEDPDAIPRDGDRGLSGNRGAAFADPCSSLGGAVPWSTCSVPGRKSLDRLVIRAVPGAG